MILYSMLRQLCCYILIERGFRVFELKRYSSQQVLCRYFSDTFVFFRLFQVVVRLVRGNDITCYGSCVIYCKSLKRWIFEGGGVAITKTVERVLRYSVSVQEVFLS